jgi:hypothetical protein
MSIIFTGVKVLVTAGKYKGKTARILSYKENTCRLIADGEFTTIQEITGRLVGALGTERPTGNIYLEDVITLDWKTPPSYNFIRSNNHVIFESLLKYCTEQYPEYLRERRRESPHASTPATTLGKMMVFPVYSTYWLTDRRKGWIEKWWPLYCAAFHDQKPDAAIKIQALLRMHFKRKDYLEILSLKPGGIGYLEVKEEFERVAAAPAMPPMPP